MPVQTLRIALVDVSFPLEVTRKADDYLAEEGSSLLDDCNAILKALDEEFGSNDRPGGRVKALYNPEDGSITVIIRLKVDLPDAEAMARERAMERRNFKGCDGIPPQIVISVRGR